MNSSGPRLTRRTRTVRDRAQCHHRQRTRRTSSARRPHTQDTGSAVWIGGADLCRLREGAGHRFRVASRRCREALREEVGAYKAERRDEWMEFAGAAVKFAEDMIKILAAPRLAALVDPNHPPGSHASERSETIKKKAEPRARSVGGTKQKAAPASERSRPDQAKLRPRTGGDERAAAPPWVLRGLCRRRWASGWKVGW